MKMSANAPPTVLIVEDERQLADLYEDWLRESFTVRKAYDGEQALAELDETVSVVLLDRRLPDTAGDDLLEEVSRQSPESRVAMVTAVEPELDIVDLGFDDYLVKPVERTELRATVDWLVDLSDYDDLFQRYFSLASKVGVLEAELDDSELEASEEYAELSAELEHIQQKEADYLDRLSESGSSDRVFRRLVAHWDRVSEQPAN